MLKSPDFEVISELISEQNPWIISGKVPNGLAPPTERPLGKYLWQSILKGFLKKHLVILGARRVGKTTVMYQTVKHLLREGVPVKRILWVRLDHPGLMNVSLDSIVKLAIKQSGADLKKPVFLFLDELVYAKNWDLWLKTFYDEKWPVRIIASSSATAALRDRRKESGIGRWEEIHLTPYLLNELVELQGKKIKISAGKYLAETIKQLTASPSSLELDFISRARKDLMSLGGFPETLSEQWTRMTDLQIKLKEHSKRIITELEVIGRKLEKLKSNKPETKGDSEMTIEDEVERDMYFIDEEIPKFEKEMKGKPQAEEDIRQSGFRKSQRTLRSDNIERAIYKDLTQSYRIDNPMVMEQFLYTLAGQITGLLSLNSIGADISGVSVPTLERYLSYLIETYLIFTVPNYAKTEGTVQRRGRKVYFVDGAIRNAALSKSKNEIFENSVELGKLQENMVAAHLHSLGHQTGIRLYHWRQGGYEVDFIYNDPKCPLAFEIGNSSRHSKRGLKEFLKEYKQFSGGCYYVAPGVNFISAQASGTGIGQLSLDFLLMACGIQQKQALKARLS